MHGPMNVKLTQYFPVEAKELAQLLIVRGTDLEILCICRETFQGFPCRR